MDSHPCAVLVYKRLGNSLALWRERNQLTDLTDRWLTRHHFNNNNSNVQHTTSPMLLPSGAETTPVSRATQPGGRRSASPASPSLVRPNRTWALRQNTSQSQKSKYPSVPVLESQVRLRSNSKSPRVSSAPCSPRQLPVAEQANQQHKRLSLEMASRTLVASLEKVYSPPKSESVPVIDSQHPPLATIGKQGTFTKEKVFVSRIQVTWFCVIA